MSRQNEIKYFRKKDKNVFSIKAPPRRNQNKGKPHELNRSC